MEYVPGRSLQDRLDRRGPLSLQEVLRIGMQTAAGLAAAHAQGLVHRDIKPANILLENGVERVRLTDFGLARAAADAGLTHSGMVAGTPHYMAPEQARGETVDHRADLFSLGSTLYAMCAGHPPFRAESPLAVLRRVCDDQPRPLRELNPEVPAWLEAIIARALMAKDPARRFQTAIEVRSSWDLAWPMSSSRFPFPCRPTWPTNRPDLSNGDDTWFVAASPPRFWPWPRPERDLLPSCHPENASFLDRTDLHRHPHTRHREHHRLSIDPGSEPTR